MTRPRDYAAVQEYLFGLKAGGPRFGIDRMRQLAAEIGHPERALPMIHLAGTNGKGSVSAMVEGVLRKSGAKVGLYTSPHLVRLGERVQVNRRILTEAEIMQYVEELQPAADRVTAMREDDRPSFFEFMTAMAFLQFQRRRCDYAVIETGLGGRLDATNIVDPAVSVITSIGLDHTEMLGTTIAAIAGEKAGIVKPGRPVVIGRLLPEAERVIRQKAQEVGAEVISVREVFGEEIGERYPQTNLEGEHQRGNAAAALLAVRVVAPEREQAGASALREVDWPGRWQRMALGRRRLVLDASHNPEGVATLDAALAKLQAETGKAPVIFCGALGADRAAALLAVVARHAKEIHLAVPNQSRASSFEELERLMPTAYRGSVIRDSVDRAFPAPGRCELGSDDDVVVVTGSIYLLGEVLTKLEPQRGANEARLQDF